MSNIAATTASKAFFHEGKNRRTLGTFMAIVYQKRCADTPVRMSTPCEPHFRCFQCIKNLGAHLRLTTHADRSVRAPCQVDRSSVILKNRPFSPHKFCHIEVDEFCHFGALCAVDYSFWKISFLNGIPDKAI
jgi:hypothetical protein